jgi:porin
MVRRAESESAVAPRAALVILLVLLPGAAGYAQQPNPGTQTDFARQTVLTGDWSGLRTELLQYGIAINGSYTAEVFANTAGGMKRGASYDGVFDSQIDVDLEKLMGWQGARVRASMLQGHGPSMSQGWVGNLLDVSGTITEPPATRLYDLWLQQKLFGGALSIRAGIGGADSEFMLSTTASLFLNSTFPWPDWMAVDLPGGGPVYPLSVPFVRVKFSAAEQGFYAQAAVFSGDPTGHDGSNSPDTGIPSGTVVSFNGGVFVIGELGYTMNQAKTATALPVTFKLGGWYHSSHRFQDQRFDTAGTSLASPASNGVPLNHHGDRGVYGMVDAMLYRARTGGTLSAFARLGGGSPGDRNLISFEGDAGLSYKGLILARADDTAGIAFGMARIGSNARGLDQDIRFFSGNPSFPLRNFEAVLEVTYQAQVTPWMTLQPDVQYVLHPDGRVLNPDGSIRRDAMVFGLHSVLNF